MYVETFRNARGESSAIMSPRTKKTATNAKMLAAMTTQNALRCFDARKTLPRLIGALRGGNRADVVAMFLIGGVILGFYALGLAIVGERVGADDLAAANAAFIVMYQGGALTGPIIAGVAMTDTPVHGFVATMIGLMVVSGTILVIFDRRERAKT